MRHYNWVIFTICLACVALWAFLAGLFSVQLAAVVAALGLVMAILMGGLFPLGSSY